MEIELKHIAPYLSYKLFCIDEKGNKMRIYTGCDDDYNIHEHGILTYIAVINRKEIKPILRPLSDLTKPINVNDEEFVPIDKINEESPISRYSVNETIIGTTILAYHKPGYNLLSENNPLYKLFEWHFDVFGLIESGLAIDINTIK